MALYDPSVRLVRHAILRLSRRRWLGLLVVLCLASLLAVLMVHSAGHDVDEGVALTCAAIVLIGMAARRAPKPPTARIRFASMIGIVSGVPAAAPPATESPPGFAPLRL